MLQVIPHAALTDAQQAEILDLCSDAYEEDFAAYLGLLGTATHVLALEGDELVAHAAWVPRELRVGRRLVPLSSAYVEAVATRPRHQRRGIGSAVLRALPPLLEAYDIAALSPSEPAFYARAGWAPWRGPLFYRHDGRRIATPEEEIMVYRLPLTPPALDLDDPIETDWRPIEVW